jgi:hypothetical protein
MAEKFNWQCPFCGHHATIIDGVNHEDFLFRFDNGNKYGHQKIAGWVVVCPNPECGEYTVTLYVANSKYVNGNLRDENPHHLWQLIPESRAQVFPSYIPEPLLADYREACLICNKSPKASATLSRRCLQGMIRDFWDVKKDRLVDAIEAIRGRVDPLTWDAIDAVRKVGNIGAHMEADIDLIVDVDPDEADLLIDLLERLFTEWYIAHHNRQESMNKIKQIAAEKEAARKAKPDAA